MELTYNLIKQDYNTYTKDETRNNKIINIQK